MAERLLKFAKQMRRTPTEAEALLWRHLRAHRFSGHKFKRQRPMGPYIADFVCATQKLVIEVDGGQHGEALHYDAARTKWLQARGFRVLRFWNHEVLQQTQMVLEAIWGALQRE